MLLLLLLMLMLLLLLLLLLLAFGGPLDAEHATQAASKGI